MGRFIAVLSILLVLWPVALHGQLQKSRDQKVREDQQKVVAKGFWIYNDLPAAFEQARVSGRPILVVFRCLPCEECVKLDDDLVDEDPVLHPLLEKFVCVRVVSTNGLDLSLFQYDTDQSFAAFMLNADRTIYGRFGTRSHRTEWVGDVSLKGLTAALEGALELHENYPANQAALAGKTGPKPLFDRPELFPALKDKYTSSLDYSGDVVKSCIHCHQIGDATRDYYREQNASLPEDVLNPYPHPKSLGLVLDADSRATVLEVQPESSAAEAGLRSHDQILTLNGQPLLSMADVQWVLQMTPAKGGQLPVTVRRGGKTVDLLWRLSEGWRQLDDISWRASAWGLRRMATGGLVLKDVSANDRRQSGLPGSGMALRVEYVGEYGPHAAGKNSGFQKGDVLVSVDHRQDLMTESAFFRYGVSVKKPGDTVPVEVLRDGQVVHLQLPMQK